MRCDDNMQVRPVKFARSRVGCRCAPIRQEYGVDSTGGKS